jgi:predicted O-methyltransferase YrrM
LTDRPATPGAGSVTARARRRARRTLVEVRWRLSLLRLPPTVAHFQLRARRLAKRTDDVFSLTSVTRPVDLRTLLSLARRRQRVVELGTATGWTAISLALADPGRHVLSCDVVQRPEPRRYLGLIDDSARGRIELAIRSGSDGPPDDTGVDLLYIDSSHQREQTVAEVLAWRPVLAPGAVIVFDDYAHPDFPGVRQAVAELGLDGYQCGTLFVHPVR